MIALLSEELDCEAADVTNSVCAAFLTTSGAQTKQYWSLLAHLVEELGTS